MEITEYRNRCVAIRSFDDIVPNYRNVMQSGFFDFPLCTQVPVIVVFYSDSLLDIWSDPDARASVTATQIVEYVSFRGPACG